MDVWDGQIGQFGVPIFVDSEIKCWNDVASHFVKVVLDSEHVEIQFLNQVQGRTVSNAPLDFTTRNNVDNGI